jgi:tRNA(Ile)-lysidine synthetase-like protein
MHFLRGAGLAGLRGMLPLTHLEEYRMIEPLTAGPLPTVPLDLIRPLLEVPRAEIERYCAEHELRPRFDRSNLDTTYFRNRLRHDLLPILEDYNPNIRERLCHTAAVVAADYDLLVQLREEAWSDIRREERDDAIVFDLAAWRALPVSLQRSTLRHATYRLRESLRDVTFTHVENARRIALRGETGTQATLPMGLALRVGYDTLVIGDADETGPPPDEPLLWGDDPLPVTYPGTTRLPESAWTLSAKLLEEWDIERIIANPDPWSAYLDAAALAEPLVLRTRRPHDRFHPHGMGGQTVKVSDLMINLKIPAAWRDHVPLLVAGEEIIWVCGHRIAESVTIRPQTERAVAFRFERVP